MCSTYTIIQLVSVWCEVPICHAVITLATSENSYNYIVVASKYLALMQNVSDYSFNNLIIK